MKVVLTTVGFSVDLIIRSLLKIGLDKGDVIGLVYSLSGSDRDRKRVEDTVKAIKNIVNKTGIICQDIVITGTDFVRDVNIIIDTLKILRNNKSIIASLVGGMRIAIIEVLVSLMLYKRLICPEAEIKLHIMREDGIYDIVLPLEAIDLPDLGKRELEALKILGKNKLLNRTRSELVNFLSKNMSITVSMAYKILHRLKKEGLLQIADGIVKSTLLGTLIITTLIEGEDV
ncbi:MAG: hypothetical protein DRN53_06710 [Thermoprotei archaeon]|nr:MAG: hypothetical protein DRN53_06710 [Thermoprotei archaeon]